MGETFVCGAHVGEVAEEKQHLGELSHDGALPRQLLRHPLVVRIEKSHEITGRFSNAEIERGALPAVLTTDIPHR